MKYEFTEDLAYWSEPFRANAKKHLQVYKNRPCRYLEIGVFEGRSLIWMANNILKHEESFGIGVDPWFGDDNKYNQTVRNVQKHEDNIGIIRGVLAGCCTTFKPASFDIIYIDGDHSFLPVLTDTCLSWPLLKVGGLMIWDDTEWEEPEYHVSEALKSILPNLKHEKITADKQAWVRKTG